ncbi:MAG: 16S rRNA (cytidine(1402)-2'-O)-methyltransferase [Myxococcales bacterium]|nr:16S rRNA (cytidine(1402)-2'-O)-methyltransferase [Myxococcales bacterium]MCB9543520.1 16S rRNA (cytidine(1402)-2'-O)-methyltransferase [Myxococcales bacterium]MCB9553929.1 16S rRNA (cytidine(1402)-2'-O)-methyltransferase [Myxococcales bacterium]
MGNLEDITLRARRVLAEVDRIACEDTRRTGKLLELIGLPRRPLVSLYDHNEQRRTPAIINALERGERIALVSDAGTPTISDPGFKVVRAAIEAGVRVVPIPGVSAVTTALSAAGLPTDRFRFVGFPPAKGSALAGALASLHGAPETLVFYVSPHGLDRFLAAAAEAFGPDRPAVIARELTKAFEEFRRAPLGELVADPGVVRGEIVVLIGGAPPEDAPETDDLRAVVARLLDEGFAPAKAAREAAKRTGGSRDEAYRLAVELRSGEAGEGRGDDEAE